jgi:hypothetical protein
MSVAMPVWRHQARREKEAELVFRGEQYARAIALYRTKNANNFPPSIDVLVQGKYLRKKYKDPMTKDGEFRVVPLGGQAGQQGTAQQQPPPGAGRGSIPPVSQPPQVQQPPISGPTGAASGGIIGVASKSTETSIRLYRGQTRYDMWPFTFNVVNRPGGAGAGAPGVQGGQPQPGMGGGRGGRGQPGSGSGPRGSGPRGSGSGSPTNPIGRGMSQPTGRPPGG